MTRNEEIATLRRWFGEPDRNPQAVMEENMWLTARVDYLHERLRRAEMDLRWWKCAAWAGGLALLAVAGARLL